MCQLFFVISHQKTEKKDNPMKEAQLCAMVVMLLLSATAVFLLPRRVAQDKVLNRSRWMIVIATFVMSLQFMLQAKMGFRAMGVTQAVMVNMVFFIPCSWLFFVALVNLQRRGRMQLRDWLPGIVSWLLTVGLLGGAKLIDGQPLMSDTPEMHNAELAAGIVYMLMQGYYSIRLIRDNKRLHNTLRDYYDHDIDEILRWMGNSSMMLAVIAFLVPFVIFSSGPILMAFSLLILSTIYYLVVRFMAYCWSNESSSVEEAQQIVSEEEEDEKKEIEPTDNKEQLSAAMCEKVEKWVTQKGYCTCGITMPQAAVQIGLTQRELKAWYKSNGFDTYSDWLQRLRIDYAKFLMTNHTEFSFDGISRQCGFSSRSYFYKVFQKLEGITPAQYTNQNTPQ